MRDNAAAAAHYRLRAEQLRTIAEGMGRAKERKMLLLLAEDYEHWARDAERGHRIMRPISK
jgi:hypothetical protein